jgi:hypothetical protein
MVGPYFGARTEQKNPNHVDDYDKPSIDRKMENIT